MSEFAKEWKNSRQPRKQRKYLFNAPYHIRHNFLNAKLGEDVAKKHGIKRIAVRKGDKVKVVRGQFKGKTGKVNRVSVADSKIFIDGIERAKIDGSKASTPITPSNVKITELDMEDRRRMKRSKTNEKQA